MSMMSVILANTIRMMITILMMVHVDDAHGDIDGDCDSDDDGAGDNGDDDDDHDDDDCW